MQYSGEQLDQLQDFIELSNNFQKVGTTVILFPLNQSSGLNILVHMRHYAWYNVFYTIERHNGSYNAI